MTPNQLVKTYNKLEARSSEVFFNEEDRNFFIEENDITVKGDVNLDRSEYMFTSIEIWYKEDLILFYQWDLNWGLTVEKTVETQKGLDILNTLLA